MINGPETRLIDRGPFEYVVLNLTEKPNGSPDMSGLEGVTYPSVVVITENDYAIMFEGRALASREVKADNHWTEIASGIQSLNVGTVSQRQISGLQKGIYLYVTGGNFESICEAVEAKAQDLDLAHFKKHEAPSHKDSDTLVTELFKEAGVQITDSSIMDVLTRDELGEAMTRLLKKGVIKLSPGIKG